MAFSTPGWPEILVILVIVLILFGAKRLPELARGIGQSLNEFRKAKSEFDDEIQKASKEIDETRRDMSVRQPARRPEPAAAAGDSDPGASKDA